MDENAADALANALAALGYSTRLQLLAQLHTPRILSDIRIPARRGEDAKAGARAAARTTILAHLEKLCDAGLVMKGQVDAQGRTLTTYAVDPARLYALVEDLRDVCAQHAGRGRSPDVTGSLDAPPIAVHARGPRLVVVHGAHEGHAWPLKGSGPWTIGRAKDAHIALDYDPYVSANHATLHRHAFGYKIDDGVESKNGTRVNWRAVPRSSSQPLQQGDIIGLGKSLLVFYER